MLNLRNLNIRAISLYQIFLFIPLKQKKKFIYLIRAKLTVIFFSGNQIHSFLFSQLQ